jgi:2-dehydro-3-deoxygalactonokinase
MAREAPQRVWQSTLIGLDWGTTSLRGWLFDEQGRVLERREAPLGVLAVTDGQFAEAFERFCASWLEARPDLPVIASGMIGSRQGWREAPYLPTPAALDTLAGALVSLDDLAGRRFRVVPGLVTRAAGGWPDVLRGEETQVFGLLATEAAASERLFVLPGTHSKWVLCQAGTVTSFRTCMTGELYSILRQHSILGRLAVEPTEADTPEQWSAFDAGVDRGVAAPASIGHLLFTVRSEALLGERAPEQLPAYLSGLLIGAEIADMLQALPTPMPCVIASPGLASRYQRALGRCRVPSQLAEDEPSRHGLFALAHQSGLIE